MSCDDLTLKRETTAGGTDPRLRARRLARSVVCHAMWGGAAKGWLAGALLAGCILLPLRQGLRIPVGHLWPLAGLPVGLAIISAVRAFRRHRFSSASAAALLDARLHYGGLLVARDLPGWDDWQQQIPSSGRAVVRSHASRLWPTIVLASLFALAAAFWPNRPLQNTPARIMELSADIARLSDQAELLAETLPDSREDAQEWIEQLQRLAEAARSDAPAETWDTLDLIAARLQEQSAGAAEDALTEMQQLQHLAESAEAMRRIAEHAPMSSALADALEQLSTALASQLSLQEYALTPEMESALRQAMNGDMPDLAALQALCDSLRGDMAAMADKLARWADAKLIDAANFSFDPADFDNIQAALDALLEGNLCDGAGDCGDGVCDSDGEAFCLSALVAGAGGIGRGPGPAPMIFGDPTSENGASYLDQSVASSAALTSPTTFEGISLMAPKPEPQAPTTAGRLSQAEADAGAARRASILPRHRRAVSGFFER